MQNPVVPCSHASGRRAVSGSIEQQICWQKRSACNIKIFIETINDVYSHAMSPTHGYEATREAAMAAFRERVDCSGDFLRRRHLS